MTKRLLLLLALLSATAHAQAMRPAPAATGPLVVQQPPSFPANPALTPAGAGASHGGLAAPGKALAPPSPNKRLLPPTKEAGLWAADGAPVAIATHTHPLFNVRLPYPSFATDEKAAEVMTMCVYSMAVAGDNTEKTTTINEFAPEVRKCMAARAVATCAEDWWRILLARKTPPPEQEELVRKTLAHATALVILNCKGAGVTRDHDDVLAEVVREFRKGVLQNLMAGRSVQ